MRPFGDVLHGALHCMLSRGSFMPGRALIFWCMGAVLVLRARGDTPLPSPGVRRASTAPTTARPTTTPAWPSGCRALSRAPYAHASAIMACARWCGLLYGHVGGGGCVHDGACMFSAVARYSSCGTFYMLYRVWYAAFLVEGSGSCAMRGMCGQAAFHIDPWAIGAAFHMGIRGCPIFRWLWC